MSESSPKPKILLQGASPALAYLACLLSDRGRSVEWECLPFRAPLRPIKIPAALLGRLRRLLARRGAPLDFLLSAPEFEGWGSPGGSRFRFSYDWVPGETDRWIDVETLFETLKRAAVAAGVRIRDCAHVAAPVEVFSAHELRVIDLREEERQSWPSAFRNTVPVPNTAMYVTELHLPKGVSDDGNVAEFFARESAFLWLEPNPRGGFAISLHSSSLEAKDRALRSLQSVTGNGPLSWRALFLMNSSPIRRDFRLGVGASDLRAPGVFPLGASFGLYPTAGNRHDVESLRQAERLAPVLDSPDVGTGKNLRESEAWFEAESRGFRLRFEGARLYEKLLFSEGAGEMANALTALLPRAARQFLRSPI